MLWPHSANGVVRRAAAGCDPAGFEATPVCARGDRSSNAIDRTTSRMAGVRLEMDIDRASRGQEHADTLHGNQAHTLASATGSGPALSGHQSHTADGLFRM